MFRSIFATMIVVLGAAVLGLTDSIAEPMPTAGLDQCAPSEALSAGAPNARLAKGFNLPNWSPDYDGWKPDDSLLQLLREQGFSHIRLPINGENLIGLFATAQESAVFLDQLEKEVLRLHGLGYAVSVDMHPEGKFQFTHKMTPNLGYRLLEEAWTKIAKRANSWPLEGIYFELLNEPNPPQEIWWPQAQRLVDLLNQVAKGRGLIVGPAVFQRYEPLVDEEPLVGENITYAIHYYDPFLFTHQSMTWEPGSYVAKLRQLPFPADITSPGIQAQIEQMEQAGEREAVRDLKETYATRWNADRIAADFAPVGAWARRHNVAVIINEFGVLNFDVDQWARIDWLRAVRKGAEKHCLGWVHWDFSDGFAMVDPRTTLPDPLVLDALLGK